MVHQGRLGARLDSRRALQVRLDHRGAGTEARTVDLQVLQHTLYVVARLGDRDALDPVDRVDLGIARVAVTLDPLFDAAAPGIDASAGDNSSTARVFGFLALTLASVNIFGGFLVTERMLSMFKKKG